MYSRKQMLKIAISRFPPRSFTDAKRTSRYERIRFLYVRNGCVHSEWFVWCLWMTANLVNLEIAISSICLRDRISYVAAQFQWEFFCLNYSPLKNDHFACISHIQNLNHLNSSATDVYGKLKLAEKEKVKTSPVELQPELESLETGAA